jgi:hypothetical protein
LSTDIPLFKTIAQLGLSFGNILGKNLQANQRMEKIWISVDEAFDASERKAAGVFENIKRCQLNNLFSHASIYLQ